MQKQHSQLKEKKEEDRKKEGECHVLDCWKNFF